MSLNTKQAAIVEQGKILWLIQTISNKFEKYCKRSFDITHRLEYMQRNLWNKAIKNVAEDKVKDPKSYVEKISDKMYPFEMKLKIRLGDTALQKNNRTQV